MTQQPETQRQIIEQQRGSQAWADIKEVKKLNKKDLEKEYRSLARGLNAMIQINGLGQTLGFLNAKKENAKRERKAHFYLLNHLTYWMHWHFDTSGDQPNPDISETTDDESNGLLDWILNKATSSDYRRATTECFAFGVWLSRFAEAELQEGNPGTSSTQPQGGV